ARAGRPGYRHHHGRQTSRCDLRSRPLRAVRARLRRAVYCPGRRRGGEEPLGAVEQSWAFHDDSRTADPTDQFHDSVEWQPAHLPLYQSLARAQRRSRHADVHDRGHHGLQPRALGRRMKTRVAIAGLGGAAERIHLPACRAVSEIEVVGACEIDEKRRKAMASRFGLACTFETCEEMLAAVSHDLVIVGTPPESHYSLSELALDAGAHVFCEKPFMSSIAEADRIIELARHNRRLLRVNNQYRFMTIYRETKQRLERNEFGRLFHVQCWQQMFHPP